MGYARRCARMGAVNAAEERSASHDHLGIDARARQRCVCFDRLPGRLRSLLQIRARWMPRRWPAIGKQTHRKGRGIKDPWRAPRLAYGLLKEGLPCREHIRVQCMVAVAQHNVHTPVRRVRGNQARDTQQLTERISTDTHVLHLALILKSEQCSCSFQDGLITRPTYTASILGQHAQSPQRPLLRHKRTFLHSTCLQPPSIRGSLCLDGLLTDEFNVVQQRHIQVVCAESRQTLVNRCRYALRRVVKHVLVGPVAATFRNEKVGGAWIFRREDPKCAA